MYLVTLSSATRDKMLATNCSLDKTMADQRVGWGTHVATVARRSLYITIVATKTAKRLSSNPIGAKVMCPASSTTDAKLKVYYMPTLAS